MRHIRELDGLRGLGAALVVAFHWAPTYIFWSWTFVNMFFVLSGYLISRIVFEAIQARRFSLRNFYMRRILRIWPVYYVALAAILAYYLLTDGTAFFDAPYFADWLRSLGYLQFTPYYAQPGVDPNHIFYFLPGMLPIWTLAVEEQFYLFLPIVLMLLAPRLGLRKLAWWCAAVALIGPAMRYVGFVPTLLLTQIDGLMLGVILAAITTANMSEHGKDGGRWTTCLFAGAVGIAVIAFTPYIIHGYQQTPGPHALFSDPLIWTWASLLFFGIIGLIVLFPRNPYSAFLRSPPLVYLGSISYAMYAFHYPLLTFIKPRVMAACGADLQWLGVAIMVLILVGLPHLSLVLMERPILALKNRFPTRKATRELG